jgi:hypothetical protein
MGSLKKAKKQPFEVVISLLLKSCNEGFVASIGASLEEFAASSRVVLELKL